MTIIMQQDTSKSIYSFHIFDLTMAFSWTVNLPNLIFYGVNVDSVSGMYYM